MIEAANRNLLWAKVFVDELARGGLEAVCVAPGSRSTPLVLAFAEHPDIRVYTHVDERGAAFFALGLALASDKPVAVLCSSGTATANFFPAIIEAKYSGVPLLVLTADRPHELRGSGANQTIDQIKMYGDQVLWSVEVALPEAEPPAVAVRNLRGLAARALATANGAPRGPVHLNFPLRKPLEPTPVESDLRQMADERADFEPFTRILRGKLEPTAAQVAEVGRRLASGQRRMIVCGPRSQHGSFPDAVARLADVTDSALIADALSNVRYGKASASVLSGYDTYLRTGNDWTPPDVVLWFGGAVTSQALDDHLNNATTRLIRVGSDGLWSDPNHRTELVLEADPTAFCEALATWWAANGDQSADTSWLRRLRDADDATRQTINAEADDMFDGLVLRDVVAALPDDAGLYVANSLPVRNLDQFALASPKPLRVFCNRGASGIDGTLSSALGAAAAQPEKPLVLVSGDLAFYHDLNGLLAAKRNGLRALFVVVNNNGGGIFHRLPVANYDPPFTELFETPHDLTFEHAAALFGITYSGVDDGAAFREAFDAALARWADARESSIVEIFTDSEHDLARRNDIIQAVAARLTSHSIATE